MICVQLAANQPTTERDVPISFSIMMISNLASWSIMRLYLPNYLTSPCHLIGNSDFIARDLPTTIRQGMMEACFLFEAVDDGIAEDTEVVTASITAAGLDEVVQNTTTVYIIDNDGTFSKSQRQY